MEGCVAPRVCMRARARRRRGGGGVIDRVGRGRAANEASLPPLTPLQVRKLRQLTVFTLAATRKVRAWARVRVRGMLAASRALVSCW